MTTNTKKKPRRSSEIGRLGLECEFVQHDTKSSYVEYVINLRCQANNTEWKIRKRYSDFYNLNNELQSDKNFRGIKLPSLPPKSIQFTEQSKKELGQKRKKDLQDYLSVLISRTVFLSSPSVIKFLEMPNSVRDAALLLAKRQNEPLKQGYMEKKGAVNKTWRKRWFVMQPNSILKYYKESTSTQPQGSIDISTIYTVISKEINSDKKYSFALKARDRVWWLSCENDQDKREWVRLFMRLKDTKAPPNLMSSGNNVNNKNNDNSLKLGPHFKTVSRIAWSPTIPGILATGSKDESVKVWMTHLLDFTLIPPSFQNYDLDDENTKDDKNNNNINNKNTNNKQMYPLHAIEFRPLAEYKTSGEVTALEWSPDGTMLVVSLKKEKKVKNDDNSFKIEKAFFIQCFDLSPVLGSYVDDDNDDDEEETNISNSNLNKDDNQRTKIFTLQDHPSRLSFSNDGNRIYMAMDIDPDSEENQERRPAFLVYLDLQQNQLHRCKTIDRVIDHQTEFIACLSMNNDKSLMVVSTCTHKGNSRLIAWDIDKNENRLIERNGVRVASMVWTEDNSWLIIGRINGTIEYWFVKNENNKKYQYLSKLKSNNQDNNNQDKNDKNDKNENNKDDNTEIESDPNVSQFDKRFTEKAHSGQVFNLTTSNGILISSARLGNKDYENFYCENIIWDIRGMMNYGLNPKRISTLHNVNENENDITRLLQLSPVTPRHVREGGGPGTLLAASGDCAVFCHNMTDVILDAMYRNQDTKN